MAIDYKTSPYIVMAIHGYHPFTPDAGILCGGYQSPIYPNPTTLTQPVLDAEIILANERDMTEFSMSTSGDFYAGLGKWNPSINWHNPGHLLGVIDMLNRMGYGLAVLREIKNGSTTLPEDILNPIQTTIPFITINLQVVEFATDNIYSLGFSEKPTAYVSSFVDNEGNLILDPRKNIGFDFTATHIPQVIENEDTSLAMRIIFQDKDSVSYLYMRKPLVNIHTELSAFSDANIASEATFIDLLPDNISEAGLTPNDLPRKPFPVTLFGGLDSHFTFPGTEDHPAGGQDVLRAFYSNFTTLSQRDAAKLLTGSDQFHTAGQIEGGPDGLEVLEHRTLTELNSAMNLVPIQTYGITFGNHFAYDFLDWFFSPTTPETYISWLICDIVLTSNIKQTVTITGTAKAERTASDPNNGPFPETFDSLLAVRNFATATSCTRDFTWNRSWWDLDKSNVKTTSDVEERATNSGAWVGNFLFFGQDPGEFGISLLPLPFVSLEEFQINEELEFDGTGQTIRVRIAIQSETISWANVAHAGDDLTIDISVQGETMDFTHVSTLPGKPLPPP